ncbi:MAG: hypothetical protein ACK4NO_00380 [Glycocaulis sp.]
MSERRKKIPGSAGFVLGRSAFARISAVEGLALSPDMHEAFARFDREGSDASTRRKELRKLYGS